MSTMETKEFDTIYIFVKENITSGKAVSQTAHAIGLLASQFPDEWNKHIIAGQRAVALSCKELPDDFLMDVNDWGYMHTSEFGDMAYASVYDGTDDDVFVLAVLPRQRLNIPQFKLY